MIFKEYKGLDLIKISNEILDFWEDNSIFKKSIESKEKNKNFIFYEGPPSANGTPGIHHMMGRTIKDIFCRYKTLKGYIVKRKGGWDTHGLPVELSVEKELGINKEDIGTKIRIEHYNKECKKAVMKYTNEWEDLTTKMGYWIDMDNPYITYSSKYIESVWWLISQLNKKKLLYKGYTIQPYSPKAGTGLSSHELNQPGTYKMVTDTTVTAQFKTIHSSLPKTLRVYDNLYFLAWTTTPWTLPSNTALSINKKITYVIIKTFNQYTHKSIQIIFAKKLIDKILDGKYYRVSNENSLKDYSPKAVKIPYFECENILGENLIGIKYEQLWKDSPKPLKNSKNAFRVISADFVTFDEGTGIVHTAPSFGSDDAIAAKKAIPEIPPLMVEDQNKNLVPLVNLQGKFIDGLGILSGKYVKNEYYDQKDIPAKSVDVEIAIRLKEENLAFKVEKYSHSYPNCWRTDKPVLYYPLDSWFVKISSKRDLLTEKNNLINWKPKVTGEGRFGNWLSNANDWNLSRSRFWGIPLPIWRTKNKKETLLIDSIEKLIVEIKKSIDKGVMDKNPLENFRVGDMSEINYDRIDLHKDKVDKIILVSKNGEPMFREPDLIDVWFDSGSMPFAQLHYPFENKEKIDGNLNFPADFICEGVDQTRGWFYTLHVISSLIFNSISYKNVISNGLVLDKKGQKMSKRIGNTINPFKTIKEFGPDSTRWYMIYNSNPWDNLKFDIEGINEVKRKFFGTLYNTYAFFSLYANIDKFSFKEKSIPHNEKTEIDQWILSELNLLIQNVDNAFNDYDPTKACRAISEFVQELLSNWYVRLSRRRFWKGNYEKDKISGYQTLFECLLTISKLCSPIAPFYSDNLYRDLCSNTGFEKFESVHLSDFPKPKTKLRNLNLEKSMKNARIISSLALSLRKKKESR
jgi:isoleucyl-tRNA synthetase